MLDGHAGAPLDVTAGLRRLCAAAVSELGLRSASITLMTAEAAAVVTGSDVDGERLAQLQFEVGEGPGMEAFSLGRPVLVSDVGEALARWPGFASEALRAHVCAVFAFPLHLGAVRFGVLTLYADVARGLEGDEVSRCLSFADIATELLLESSTSGSVDLVDPRLDDALRIRTEVYQAQGMVMVDLGVSLAEALLRMRAHAYANGGDLNELASDIIAGRLRLQRDES